MGEGRKRGKRKHQGTDLRRDLEELINLHGREEKSGTPDFIAAKYLMACLNAFEAATVARDKWYAVEAAKERLDVLTGEVAFIGMPDNHRMRRTIQDVHLPEFTPEDAPGDQGIKETDLRIVTSYPHAAQGDPTTLMYITHLPSGHSAAGASTPQENAAQLKVRLIGELRAQLAEVGKRVDSAQPAAEA